MERRPAARFSNSSSPGLPRTPGSLWCFALACGLPSMLEKSKLWGWLRSRSGHRRGRVDWVSGTAMVVRRSLWQEIGPFDLGYRLRGQYIDLCCSAANAGWRIEIIPGFGVVHPLGDTTSSDGGSLRVSDDELMWTDILRFARKRNGDGAARQSGRALRMGGNLRLFGRRIASPLVPRNHKEEWQAETTACARALKAVGSSTSRQRPQP